jgi:hypothetical protein
MPCSRHLIHTGKSVLTVLIAFALLIPVSGCREAETLKREVIKKFRFIVKTKKPFKPRDGMTIRTCSLYQTANPNSEVIRKLPAETPVHLIDKVGEWYRVRMRDGREGYLARKMVGGEEIIRKTQELRKSIEGVPPQAEGVIKTKANFRLRPGRRFPVVEVLPPGKRFEMYERVATLRRQPAPGTGEPATAARPGQGLKAPQSPDLADGPANRQAKKDIWYKVKIEDGRVGYIYTYNLRFTPPEDIARMVTWMRLLAWRTINTTDDPDLGPKNNYVVAYAPIGEDPGCDFTQLYLMIWDKRRKKRIIARWRPHVRGILPITDFHFEGRPGFSIRRLHPTKPDKLILVNFVYSRGRIRKISEEEIPGDGALH